MTSVYLFSLVNLILSGIIVFISVCRLNTMQEEVMMRVRAEYAVYIGAAIANGLQPWWGEYPEWGTCSLAFAVVFGMLCSSKAWAGDVAPDEATDRAPLSRN